MWAKSMAGEVGEGRNLVTVCSLNKFPKGIQEEERWLKPQRKEEEPEHGRWQMSPGFSKWLIAPRECHVKFQTRSIAN